MTEHKVKTVIRERQFLTFPNTEKTGRVGTELTGYPSIDKPWLKYLENKITDLDIPQCDVFEYLKKSSQQFGKDVAIEYLSCRISYNKLLKPFIPPQILIR